MRSFLVKKKLIELDFLMIYEHKVRELENLCLLKYELERRGYKVKIIQIDDAEAVNAISPIYHAKVVVLMACYRNSTLEWHTKNYVVFDKVIDMQWENIVYPKDEKAANVFKNYSGIGKEVVRVSWGEANRTRLLETAHMNPKNVKVVGHVGMDFLRDELKGYYIDKKSLFSEYSIPVDKKIILFASPFYSDNLSKDYIEDMCSRFGEEWRDYYAFMLKSEVQILQWFEQLCKERKDIFVIYRPHPGHIGKNMERVARNCDNFRIISERSIKQWIVASDLIYTGNSSTIVEAFFAKKPCHLLFPYDITAGFELQLLSKAEKIRNYEEFYATIDSENKKFPITDEAIKYIYSYDEIPSYIKFANMAEEVLSNQEYALTREQLKSYRSKVSTKLRLQNIFKKCNWGYGLYLKLIENDKLHSKWLDKQREIRDVAQRTQKQIAREITNENEIDMIVQNIKMALEERHR